MTEKMTFWTRSFPKRWLNLINKLNKENGVELIRLKKGAFYKVEIPPVPSKLEEIES